MKISRIELANHRSVPDLEIEVRDHLVVVGSNDAGKSTFLRLLDTAIHGSMAALHAALDIGTLRDAEAPLRLLVRFVDFDSTDKAALPDQIETLPDGEYQLSLVVVATRNVGTDDVSIERYFLKPGLRAVASSAALDAVRWTYLPANRSPDRELTAGRASAVQSLLGAIDLGRSLDAIVAAVDDLHEAVHSAESLKALRSELAIALGRLLPRTVEPDDIVLELPRTSAQDPLADVAVKLRDDDQTRPLRDQSDGVRAMSTVAIKLMAASGAQMVAVDEPEIHLHPRAQAQVASRLRSRSTQAIVATHSTAVVTQFSPMDALVFVAGSSRQLSAEPFADAPKLKEHWWTTSVLEPLTSRGVILVEGISDRVLVEAVARWLGLDFDRSGVSVVEVEGATNFKMPIQLFGATGFGIPVAGLVDLNEAPDVAGYLGVSTAALNSSGFFVSSPDLEGECVVALGVPRHVEMLVTSGLFTERSILVAHGCPAVDDIDPIAHAAWCRNKRKIQVAMALGAVMTEADATALTSLTAVASDIAARLS